MNVHVRLRGTGLIALLLIATAGAAPLPAQSGEVTIASIPLFARIASDGESLRSYSAPVSMDGSLHKWFFSFHFDRNGTVEFKHPAKLDFAFDSVPRKYSNMFGELGTPRTWPAIYDLVCVKATQQSGVTEYEIHGVPKDPSSDVDHVVIQMNDQDGPIDAHWVLRDGWDVKSTITLESVENYLLPKEEDTSVTGHGYRIHTDLTYGTYVLTSTTSAGSAA